MAEPRAPRAGARWLWPLLALPGTVWLAVLFVAPLYVVLAILFGGVDPILRQPVPVWNPVRLGPVASSGTSGSTSSGRTPSSGPRWSAPSCTSAWPACSAC